MTLKNNSFKPGSIFPKTTITKLENISNEYFEAKASKVPGAGLGLFARAHVPAYTEIGIYRGVVLSQGDLDALYQDGLAPYVVTLYRDDGSKVYVDAISKQIGLFSNRMRYINAPWGTSARENVQMDSNGKFVTIRDLTPGCELLWDYGQEYFEVPEVQILEDIENC